MVQLHSSTPLDDDSMVFGPADNTTQQPLALSERRDGSSLVHASSESTHQGPTPYCSAEVQYERFERDNVIYETRYFEGSRGDRTSLVRAIDQFYLDQWNSEDDNVPSFTGISIIL